MSTAETPDQPSARRAILLGGVMALLVAGSARAQTPAAKPKVDVFDAYRKMIASTDGGDAAWWFEGSMFAHVDGLREFSVVQVEAVTLVRLEPSGDDGARLTWRQFGYYRDIVTGEVAATWPNPFLGKTFPLPKAFREGPDLYTLKRTSETSATLALTPASARVISASLTGAAAEGRITVTQSETKIQGFPGPDGRLPPLSAPGATGLQRVISLVADQAAVEDPATRSVPCSGFFSMNYDSLPPWMGFGDRYGAALIKGVLHKATSADKPNLTAWKRLKALHPDAFKGDRLKTDWS